MSRVILIAWDGADWRILDPLLERGDLVEAARVLEQVEQCVAGGRDPFCGPHRTARVDRQRLVGVRNLEPRLDLVGDGPERAGGRVPQPHRVVRTSGGKAAAVGAGPRSSAACAPRLNVSALTHMAVHVNV
mgnify:CR=1 FL=1